METTTGYELVDSIEISYTAYVHNGSIEFNPGYEDWASKALFFDGRLIAENIAYQGTTIHDLAKVVNYLISQDVVVDCDDPEDVRMEMATLLSGADDLYEEASAEAKNDALLSMITDESWQCYRQDGSFANEYTLYLVAAGKELDDDIDADTTTPDEWVEAWGRYPDPITESYVSVCVIQ